MTSFALFYAPTNQFQCQISLLVHTLLSRWPTFNFVTIQRLYSYRMSALVTYTLALATLNIAIKHWQPFILQIRIGNPSPVATGRYIIHCLGTLMSRESFSTLVAALNVGATLFTHE